MISTQTLEDVFRQLAERFAPEIIRIRRLIHQYPELAFQEFKTASLVEETLKQLAMPVRTGIAGTGVIATLKGAKPGPTIALRADMDALPIEEKNTFPFASKHQGTMHACGHDAHTAMLLGVAMILSEIRNQLHGTIRFIFQPSEEKLPGGALAMIQAGALDADTLSPAPQSIFAQHVFPDLPTGTIGLRRGPYMAAVDELYFTIKGPGGHAASPHRLGGDTVLAAAHMITALQSIISRDRPPNLPAVLSIGKVNAPGATNILPEEVQMAGTLRSMDESWRERAHHKIKAIAQHTAEAFGATCEVTILKGYPVLVNDPALTDFVRERAIEYVGADRVHTLEPTMGSEDFAWYLQKIPGVFYRLGIRNEAKGIVHGLHTPQFTVDEEALPIGSGFMAYLAFHKTAQQSEK